MAEVCTRASRFWVLAPPPARAERSSWRMVLRAALPMVSLRFLPRGIVLRTRTRTVPAFPGAAFILGFSSSQYICFRTFCPGLLNAPSFRAIFILRIVRAESSAVVESTGDRSLQNSRLSIRKLLNLNVLWFCVNAQYAALIPVVIPTQILLFVNTGQVGNVDQAAFLSWLTAAASFISFFMPPLVGHFSDQTAGRFGRRRPYILIGGLLQTFSVIFLATANTVVFFLLGLSILHVGNNILTPAYQGLIPDQVSREQRGAASGYVGAMTILGNVVGLALAALLLGGITQQAYNAGMIRAGSRTYYSITAAIMLIGLVFTLIGVHEKPRSADRSKEQKRNFSQRFVQAWVQPWHNYNFTLVFFTRFSIMLGLAMFMTFIEYYFARVQHIGNFVQFTAGVSGLALRGGGVCAGTARLFS